MGGVDKAVFACTLVMLAGLATPASAQLQTAHVRGTVLDAAGQPVSGAEVALADPLGAVLQASTSDAAGRFSFAGVPPGRFALRAAVAGSAGRAAFSPVVVEAALPVDVVLRLPPTIEESVHVEGRFDAASTRVSIAGRSLDAVPVRVRGRSLQDAVATLPGWATEDNGLLHARGVDDGFLYVVDGMPVYERLDALNGVAPDASSIASINVVTGYVAPEFGHKAGGVIEVRSRAAADRWRLTGDAGLGSNATVDGGLALGGGIGRHVGITIGASAQRSDRFLDPVHPDNLHNTGAAAATFGSADVRGGDRDRVAMAWHLGRSHYDVPHTEEQDEAGQDQRQRVSQGSLSASWQRIWSDRTVAQVAGYHRRSGAGLEGSAHDTPLFADSDRGLWRTGGIASVSHQRGAHLVKAGVEAQTLSLDEAFDFFVTDEEDGIEAGLSDGALAHDAGNPFTFADRASPSLWSLYLQDHWQAGSRLTVGAGVRFDRSTLMLRRTQWSPRVGVSYRAGDTTVFRGSLSRFYQPPQPEYLLLSSSPEARELSPFVSEPSEGGADVEPERQWAFEAGIEQHFLRWRLDAAYWRRDGREMADPNVFFGTTVVFPNAVAKGRAQGVDVRVEVPSWRGWSGYASGSVGKVVQTGPVTGGLFLEDEIASIGPGTEFVPDHDQRVVLASGVMWEHARSGITLSLAARYESGTPVQRDEDDEGEFTEQPGSELVDFDRGRVKPRTLLSLVAAVPLVQTDRVHVHVRGAILNLFDRLYAYNFGNPFSGTHFGAPRTASVSLQVAFE